MWEAERGSGQWTVGEREWGVSERKWEVREGIWGEREGVESQGDWEWRVRQGECGESVWNCPDSEPGSARQSEELGFSEEH
eukprot:5073670-Pleurochrysis_carterae.AAC.1